MHALSNGNELYLYIHEQHFVEAMGQRSTARMYMAHYAFTKQENGSWKVIKDRSGVFNQDAVLPLKKILEIVKILEED